MSILDLMKNTADAAVSGAIVGNLASPHGVLIMLALVIGVGYWRHERRGPARDMSRPELDNYQG